MNDTDFLDLDLVVTRVTTEHELVHPVTGQPTSARVLLAGPEHPDRRRLVHAALRSHRDEYERTGKIGLDPDDAEVQTLSLVAGCTLGWSGLKAGGQELSWSADACTAFYADPRRAWVRDQVKAALDRRDLFIGSSATS